MEGSSNCMDVLLQRGARRLTGLELSKKEMKPYEARLQRSKTLLKYDIIIKPRPPQTRVS